jgi:hypothetical protein
MIKFRILQTAFYRKDKEACEFRNNQIYGKV